MLYLYDPLVKWSNTPPSQGGIHGFETHTGYQMILKSLYSDFFNSYILKFTNISTT